MAGFPDPKSGDRGVKHLGAYWSGVVCLFHRGEEQVDSKELRSDQGDVLLVPVYSKDVGHVKSCESCQAALRETRLHVRAVEQDLEQAAAR